MFRPLDKAVDSPERMVKGDVKLLDNIPFDFRERHPELFKRPEITHEQANPSSPNEIEPGINDDLVYGKSR